MKFVNFIKLTPQVSSYYIDPFDIGNSKPDEKVFMKLIRALYQPGETIFFIMEGELQEGGTSMHSEILNYFEKKGAYQVIDKENSTATGFIGYLTFDNDTPAFLLKLWRYFVFLRFFKPSEEITWDKFCSFGDNLFWKDQDAIKFITFRFTNLIGIKGTGGESLTLSFSEGIALPDIKKLLEK